MSSVVVAMSLPVGDWQFWVVTLICLVAAVILLRDALPIPALKRRRKRLRGERRAKLTISARGEGAKTPK